MIAQRTGGRKEGRSVNRFSRNIGRTRRKGRSWKAGKGDDSVSQCLAFVSVDSTVSLKRLCLLCTHKMPSSGRPRIINSSIEDGQATLISSSISISRPCRHHLGPAPALVERRETAKTRYMIDGSNDQRAVARLPPIRTRRD